jgi:tRNA/tmRNA/rRNA uracil-C5-methylase (TrmA/RlmC/RlmD family)
VNPGAADALVSAVQDLLRPATGEHVLDLYSGVGLFAGPIADAVGVGGRVDAVESSAQAVRDARANIGGSSQVHLHHTDVLRFLKETRLRRCDGVVLDPPRAGAGRGVLERVTRLRPRAICYVACDPAALGRDVALLAGWGYSLARVRVFDLFPMTHHVECVALFERATG